MVPRHIKFEIPIYAVLRKSSLLHLVQFCRRAFALFAVVYRQYYAVNFLLKKILHLLADGEVLKGAMLRQQIAVLWLLPVVLSKATDKDHYCGHTVYQPLSHKTTLDSIQIKSSLLLEVSSESCYPRKHLNCYLLSSYLCPSKNWKLM